MMTNYVDILDQNIQITSTADPLERAKDTVEWFMTGYNPLAILEAIRAYGGLRYLDSDVEVDYEYYEY
ncbi:MAG: hypothetical protein ACYSUB_20760 [Planctomycetota bacterium]|jgi:hypothetical protein